METVESFVQSIDPNLLAIAIVVMMVAFIIMMCIYIPRIEKLRQLENDKKRYKAERNYAVEQWSIAMISGNRQKDKILNDLKNTEGRKNQYSKIAKTMAEAYDKLKEERRKDLNWRETDYDIFVISDELRISPNSADELDFSDKNALDRMKQIVETLTRGIVKQALDRDVIRIYSYEDFLRGKVFKAELRVARDKNVGGYTDVFPKRSNS